MFRRRRRPRRDDWKQAGKALSTGRSRQCCKTVYQSPVDRSVLPPDIVYCTNIPQGLPGPSLNNYTTTQHIGTRLLALSVRSPPHWNAFLERAISFVVFIIGLSRPTCGLLVRAGWSHIRRTEPQSVSQLVESVSQSVVKIHNDDWHWEARKAHTIIGCL